MNIIKLSENQIVNQYQGFDLYYDRQDKILYSTPKALARWIGCDPRTVKKVVGNLGLGKTATIPTTQGLKKGNLLTSAEVIKILEALANSKRTKKETRKSASSKITTMAQVGYELTGMLAIAPDELAKSAINHIQDRQQIADVENHANQHALYLKEYHGLHDQLKNHGAEGVHHAVVNKHNNQLVGIEKGKREEMTEYQKDAMTFIQLAEKMKLAREKKRGAWNAVNTVKQAGEQAQESLINLLK
jgi:hypothetical protein